ncbi:hypothetical protein HAX54_052445, partial [Datura stramonium]|nr:hypothetical protein [Datura stramonium]
MGFLVVAGENEGEKIGGGRSGERKREGCGCFRLLVAGFAGDGRRERGGSAMREKRESAAACYFSGVGDGRRRGEEVEREVTGWVCCRKLWRYGCLLVGGQLVVVGVFRWCATLGGSERRGRGRG